MKKSVLDEKNGSEQLCVQAMMSHNNGVKYINICQVLDKKIDANQHIDIICIRILENGQLVTRFVDVKSLTSNNLNTGNYCINQNSYQIVLNDIAHIRDYAFRLAENGKLTNKFLIADGYEVLTKCNPVKQIAGDNDIFYLVSIQEVKENCSCVYIESDIS